jgi:sugar phosphate isomerase/epimerase
MRPISRRRFLESLAAGAAWATAGRSAAAGTSGRSSILSNPGYLHVFAKPFTALDFTATAALIAEAGWSGIDLTVRRGGQIDPANATRDLPRAVEAARAVGLRIDAISTDIVAATPATRRLLAAFRESGISVYRLGNFTYDPALGPWKTLQSLKPRLADLADLNAEFGIHGAIQNHSGKMRVGAAGWDLHELVRDLDPRWLGCQYDIRHATVVGGQSWATTFDLLTPWIHSIVLKDFRWIQRPGEQEVANIPLGAGICDLAGFLHRVVRLPRIVPWSLHVEYEPFEPVPSSIPDSLRAELLAGLQQERATLTALLTRISVVGS